MQIGLEVSQSETEEVADHVKSNSLSNYCNIKTGLEEEGSVHNTSPALNPLGKWRNGKIDEAHGTLVKLN